MTYSHPAPAIPRRSKSEGHLDQHSSTQSKTMPWRWRPVDPASTTSTASSLGGTKDCIKMLALDQWNALADREEGQPAYQISSGSAILSNDHRRGIIADWAMNVVDWLQVDRRVVGVSFFYIDRYLSDEIIYSRYTAENSGKSCWLIILSCLKIAMKLHSNKNETFIRRMLSSLCLTCQFSPRQVAEKELEICTQLQWHLNPPVPIMYLEVATPIIENIAGFPSTRARQDVIDLSQFLIELSVYDQWLSNEKGSSVAHAAILVAMNHYNTSTNTVNKWLSLTLQHSSYSTDRCIPRVQMLLKSNEHISRCSSPTNVGGSL